MNKTRKNRQPRQPRQPRQTRQTGGNKERVAAAFAKSDGKQVIHCVSQLKRFAPCIHVNALRSAQFFYNLGRLQELLGETKHPEIWWKPIEKILNDGNFQLLPTHVDSLRELIGADYDESVLAKGC